MLGVQVERLEKEINELNGSYAILTKRYESNFVVI